MRTSSDPGQAFLKQQLRGASLRGLSEHSSSLQEQLEQSTSRQGLLGHSTSLQGLLGHSISLEGLLEQSGAQGPADEVHCNNSTMLFYRKGLLTYSIEI